MIRLILLFILFTNLNSDFLRNNTLGIVIDTTKGLIWQDNNSHITTGWENVINPLTLGTNKCANLSFAGFNDWRLPNLNELKTIIDYNTTNPSIKNIFQNIPASINGHLDFISSTTANPTSKVWYINFWSGEILSQEKDSSDFEEKLYFMCVRNR